MSEVDQTDLQVRLQELLRDKKSFIEDGLRSIERTYEHLLQDNSTELNELETSITNKSELVRKLQDDILQMTVRKELLTKAISQMNQAYHVN